VTDREVSTVQVLGILFAVFVACYLPFFAVYVIKGITNHAADGCVYRDSCCDIQPWAGAAHLYCGA